VRAPASVGVPLMGEPWRALAWMVVGVIAAAAITAFWLWRERWVRRRRRGAAD
jgi:hypothetical protein